MIAEGLFSIKKKPGPGLCMVQGCRKDLKATHATLGLCSAHFQQRWRHFNARPAAYNMLRDHAKGRGIPFLITIDYFLGLADAYAFFDHEAESRGETLSIDRVDSTKGYEPRNLRIITQSQNAAREGRERFLPPEVRNYLAKKRAKAKEAMADIDAGYRKRLEEMDAPF